MLTVTKKFEFEAAHHLPEYDGKCNNIHGHTFKLEVEVSDTDPVLNGNDIYSTMIIDFGDLKRIVNEMIIDKLDHKYLNDIFAVAPTSETIVIWIVKELKEVFGVNLQRVRLHETSNSFSEWRNTNDYK